MRFRVARDTQRRGRARGSPPSKMVTLPKCVFGSLVTRRGGEEHGDRHRAKWQRYQNTFSGRLGDVDQFCLSFLGQLRQSGAVVCVCFGGMCSKYAVNWAAACIGRVAKSGRPAAFPSLRCRICREGAGLQNDFCADALISEYFQN